MQNIYQMEITLRHNHPPIWRLFQCPGNFTFFDLHCVIQGLMGWTDNHLHEFEVGRIRIGTPQDNFLFPVQKVKDEDLLTLESVIPAKKTGFLYTYDFGDNWVHELLVEDIIVSEQNMEHPVCLDGRRAGPPEDIGGVWGYERALQIVKTPRLKNPEDEHEEIGDRREWLEHRDPEYFNLEEINQQLKYIETTDLDSLVEPLPDNEEISQPATIKGHKIGRNEPCPCGSGKNIRNAVAGKSFLWAGLAIDHFSISSF